MKKELLCSLLLALVVSCQKENMNSNTFGNLADETLSTKKPDLTDPPYDLNVTLRGTSIPSEGDEAPVGHLKFRRDSNPEIIDLDVKLHNMLPNHEYIFQRAVDPIYVIDGNCSSTIWLSLQSIFTDNEGNAKVEFWRDLSAIPTGSKFDVHYQVIDAATNITILGSDCFQYQVR